jgi:cellulose synthase operon protein C
MLYHRRGYKLRSQNTRHLDSIAKHIAFLALTDNLGRSVRLFEKHLPDALQTTNVFNRLRFLTDTLPLLDRLLKTGQATKYIRVPIECPIAIDGKSTTTAIRDWVQDTATELAAAFDARNGNDYYGKRLTAAGRLQRWFDPCPLTR